MKNVLKPIWTSLLVLGLLGTYACQPGPGPAGPPGVSTGTLKGTVTNSLTKKPVADVDVVTDPVIPDIKIKTDASGNYTATLPIGIYTMKFQKTNFTAVSQTVSLVAGQTFSKNITLQPTAKVITNAGADKEGQSGASITLEAVVTTLDDSTINSYQWTQVSGAAAKIDNAKEKTARITLNTLPAYKEYLLSLFETLDRVNVQAINPHVLEAAEACTFKVTVVTTSGSYSDTVVVTTPLPYAVNNGLRNVPAGLPVLVHGKTQSAYEWSITAPAGSKSKLEDPTSRYTSFNPDVAGEYILTEKNSKATLTVYAGTYQGAISGIDDKGTPIAATCTTCHNGTIAEDQFTAWRKSGHADIFTSQLNTGTHYTEACFSCHTVGFNPDVANKGIDEASDYKAFADSGILSGPNPTNWKNTVAQYPQTAKMANIQCENCHGPNNHAKLHPNTTPTSARVSLSSDVCAECHGEPLRHARFQQWEESKHANMETAIAESGVETRGASAGHCGRCHSGNGFLQWISQGDLTKRIQGAKGDATIEELTAMGMGKDNIQPITCAVCHDPHDPGSTSGEPNNTTVRIQGNTSLLPSGYQAVNVGRGAICITCHNTRNGLHDAAHLPTNYSAPHVAAQGDVLMGQNAYLVNGNQRSPHANITDSCVRCHMEITPPPAQLSYQLAGTNHSFSATLQLCSSCHSDALNATSFQTAYEQLLEELAAKMGEYLLSKLPDKVTVKDYTPHTTGGKSYDIKSAVVVIDKTNIVSIGAAEVHGQQGFAFKLKQGVAFSYTGTNEQPHSVTLEEAQVQLGDITTDGKTAVIAPSDILVQAGWNYYLVHGDSSLGIHNPGFVDDVLRSSLDALFPVNVPQTGD